MIHDKVENPDDAEESSTVDTAIDEVEEFQDPTETVVMAETDFGDSAADASAEINVEELVAKVEAEQEDDVLRKKEVRRKLEELAENKQFDDTYAVEFD